MKKLLVLFAMAVLAMGLVACGSKKTDEKVLANDKKDYYSVGQFNGWGEGIKAEYKMEAVKLSDSRIASVKDQLKDATCIYVLEITVAADQAWTTDVKDAEGEKIATGETTKVYYTDAEKTEVSETETEFSEDVPVYKTLNGGLCVKIVRTAKGDAESIDWWGQNPESGEFTNLTPNTLYLPAYVAEKSWNDNPAALEAGTYTVVYAEGANSFKALGLIKK